MESVDKDFRLFECSEFVCSLSQTCIYAPAGESFCKKYCYTRKCEICFMKKSCRRNYNEK